MEKQELTYLILFITLIFLIFFAFIMAITLNYYRRNKKYNTALMRLEFERQQELLRSQLEIQEQTFKNISQEIHDNIGQGLSLAKLNINTMDVRNTESLQNKINTSKDLITKAIQDLRDLSKSLNTDYVAETGLVRSVEYELEMLRNSGSYTTSLDVEGKIFRLDSQQELIIFRIFQEVLHNIIKHAKATDVEVQIKFSQDNFFLRVSDNGIGFDASGLSSGNYKGFGLGLRNISNRAKLIEADYKLQSIREVGTTVDLSLKLKNVNHKP